MDPTRTSPVAPPPTPFDQVEGLIARARRAQAGWAGASLRERCRCMLRVRRHLVDHAEEIAETISRDTGKTRIDALTTEVLPAAMGVGYYVRHAGRFLKDRLILPGNLLLANKWSRVTRVPYGVVGVISPWNYPFVIPFSDVVTALLAGNGVVLKCASCTQMTGRTLLECFRHAGLPQDLFAYVNMPGREAGGLLLKHGIDKLLFTGSVIAGKQLMAEAAKSLTPLVLELGGSDPMLVCADADVYRAAAGAAWAGFQNCGQSCNSAARLYVHERVYAAFMEALKRKVESLRVGSDDGDFPVDMGALTTDEQVAKVRLHEQDALSKGARVYARSRAPAQGGAGRLYPATVLVDVDHTMLVMKEETFGPVIAVMKVRDMEEAVTLANDSAMGLTASVWSRNRRMAERIGRRIRSGVLTINDHLVSYGQAEAPFGGVKESGFGWAHGRLGFDEMTHPQVVVHDILPFARQQMWWYPYSRQVYAGMLGALRLLYGATMAQRAKGLCALLRIVPRYFRKT